MFVPPVEASDRMAARILRVSEQGVRSHALTALDSNPATPMLLITPVATRSLTNSITASWAAPIRDGAKSVAAIELLISISATELIANSSGAPAAGCTCGVVDVECG